MNTLQGYMPSQNYETGAQAAQLASTTEQLQAQQNAIQWYGYPNSNWGNWGGTCPSCGYCRCCGRSNNSLQPQPPFVTYGQFQANGNTPLSGIVASKGL